MKLFPKIKITIMEPCKIAVPEDSSGRMRRNLLAKELYDVMTYMMFEGSDYKSTLFESIIDASKQYGSNSPILEDADYNQLTYSKILKGSFVLSDAIKKYTKERENVGIMLPNAVGAAVVFLAMQAINRVPAMINYSTGPNNILSSCAAALVTKIYTSKRFIERASLENLISILIHNGIEIIYLEDVRSKISLPKKLLGVFKSYFPKYFYISNLNGKVPNEEDPAVILFTSGSEGKPKGVQLSHANIQANIKQVASRIDFASNDKVFSALPIFHSFGLMGGFLLPLISGVKVFFYPSPLHYRIIPEMVYGSNSSILFGTDTFLWNYAQHAHPYDFFSVRYIVAGAEKLREETRQLYMDKFGIRILEGYGVTESAPAISVNTPMHYKAGSVGRILPAIKYKIEPVEGIEGAGKLIINGPNVMMGYLKHDKPGILEKPEYMIDGKLRKNWYDTGDIVSVDEEGFLTIVGRYKRFAKIAGEMISLFAVEENLSQLCKGMQYATLNIPDKSKGEAIVLFINDKSINKERILKHFKELGISELFIPRIIHYLDELPLLATGKVDYVKLKELWESRAE